MMALTGIVEEWKRERAYRRGRLLLEGRVQRYILHGEALADLLLALTAEQQAKGRTTITAGLPGDALFVRMAMDEVEHREQRVVLFFVHETFPTSESWTWLSESSFDVTLETFPEEEAV